MCIIVASLAELSVGMQTEGVDIRSVGNTTVRIMHKNIALLHYPLLLWETVIHVNLHKRITSGLKPKTRFTDVFTDYCVQMATQVFFPQVLQDTALIETFNLKAAIEYQLKNCKRDTIMYIAHTYSLELLSDEAAQEAITDMPPRSEEELDPVTLHNQAVMNDSPTQGFEKLQFLLQQVPCPPETFANLLLLYVKYEVHYKGVVIGGVSEVTHKSCMRLIGIEI